MTPKYCFEAFDATLKDVMRITNETEIIFGGKMIVFRRNFRKILLVIIRRTHYDVVHATINAS